MRLGSAYDVARNSLQNFELVRLSYWINARKQLSRLQFVAPANAARRVTDVTRLMKCIFEGMRWKECGENGLALEMMHRE